MPATWVFLAFDWALYRAYAPRVRRAASSGDFAALDLAEVREVLSQADDDAGPAAVANAVLAEICCRGEPAVFEGSLPRVLRQMRRHPDGDDAADSLGELAFGAPGVEAWFRATSGVVGLHTPEQTAELARWLAHMRQAHRPAPPPRGLAALTGRFLPGEGVDAALGELLALVKEAAAHGDGLAALAP
ncbi:MAG: hypothetical protein IT208_04760 [Chthonomonadales bacterium]|nr:hypothetical protein [Chthonomonadales bacterium]